MKVLVFLLVFGSLNACEMKSDHHSKENVMHQKSIIDLVRKNDIVAVKSALENGADVKPRIKKEGHYY